MKTVWQDQHEWECTNGTGQKFYLYSYYEIIKTWFGYKLKTSGFKPEHTKMFVEANNELKRLKNKK